MSVAVGAASTPSIIFSMMKTIVGAGMLALPFAYRQQGIVLATFSIVLAAATTGLGIFFQAYSAGFLPKGDASFASVSKITYPRLAIVFDCAIAIKCFGVAVSYLVIVGGLCPIIVDYFHGNGILLERRFWVVVALLLVSPLCFQRSLDSLRYTSMLGLASAAYLVVLVVGHFIARDTLDDKGKVRLGPKGAMPVLQSLPIILFAYTCAQNMFSGLNEMRHDRSYSILTLIFVCMGGSCFLYVLTGLTGYLSFGDNVVDNIITMYPQSILSTLGRVAMVFLVVFSYPLQIHPARASALNIFNAIYPPARPRESAPLLGNDDLNAPVDLPTENRRFRGMTLFLLLLSFLIAFNVSSLEAVLSFVGAIGATSISYILPGIFGYKLTKPSETGLNRTFTFSARTKGLLNILSIALTAWGFLTMGLSLGANIYRFWG